MKKCTATDEEIFRGNFERRVTRCTTPGNPPCRGNFSPCEQNAKAAPDQRVVLRMLIINV